MAGSTYGTIFRIMTWGESHGKGVGVTIDGCPAGLPLCEEDVQTYLNRRKPGQSKFATARNEGDQVEILSGVFEGKTTGTPIAMMVRNTDQRSRDYSAIKDVYRPGHADYCFEQKYGFRDYRGGGRSSARETIARVAAGAVACKLLAHYGITVNAYVKSIGEFEIDPKRFDLSERDNNSLIFGSMIGFSHFIFAQAQSGFVRMRHGFDAVGIDALHVFNHGENVVQLGKRFVFFFVR